MSFETTEIKKIAHLARLAIDDKQAENLADDFTKILGLVEKMGESDTSETAPLSHPYDTVQPMRTDNIAEDNQRELLQMIAPEVKAGLYIVPQFIETE